MTLEDTKQYLDAQPGILALFWFMENVTDENPDRSELFFYCRERVRRYQKDYKIELNYDAVRFQLLEE